MTSTVTVGCKLPNGLILRIFDMVDGYEQTLGGPPRAKKEAIARETTVHIKGNSFPASGPRDVDLRHGYALTYGVDAEFWHKWFEQNKNAPYVRNGLIFASDKNENVIAEAKEKETVRSGFERLTPDNDPRHPVHKADGR